MDNKKWTDSDLQTAYEDGCKFFNLADLKDFLLKRRELAVSTESKCNKHIVNGRCAKCTHQNNRKMCDACIGGNLFKN